MKVFHVTVLANTHDFESAVAARIPGNFLKITGDAWLVAGSGTAQEMCAKLGMPTVPGERSPFSAVVTGISGYYGYGGSNIWEWVAAKQAQDA